MECKHKNKSTVFKGLQIWMDKIFRERYLIGLNGSREKMLAKMQDGICNFSPSLSPDAHSIPEKKLFPWGNLIWNVHIGKQFFFLSPRSGLNNTLGEKLYDSMKNIFLNWVTVFKNIDYFGHMLFLWDLSKGTMMTLYRSWAKRPEASWRTAWELLPVMFRPCSGPTL